MKKLKKLGFVTSFKIIFYWYVAKKPCAEMYLLRQSYQIIPRASIWQGNLTYHMFLIVKWQKKSKPFCRVVDNTYVLLSTVLNWFSDCVVDQGFHVSHLWGCHRGDARVTRSSHRWELCTTMNSGGAQFRWHVTPVTKLWCLWHSPNIETWHFCLPQQNINGFSIVHMS